MNAAALFSMEARALYIWGAFGAFALVIALEVFLLRARLKRVVATLHEEHGAAASHPAKGAGK